MDWRKIVGANLRRLRLERNLTQEQLAHDSELDLTYVGGIERAVKNPSVIVLGMLAESLQVHPREFFEDI